MLNFKSHFNELKYRIFYIGLSFMLTFTCSYFYIGHIIYILSLPFLNIRKINVFLNQSDFIFTTIFEAFSSYLFISGVIACYFIIPNLLYGLFSFLKSGLTLSEKKYLKFIIKLFLIFFFFSMNFAYWVCLPFILKFFIGFEEIIKANLFTLKLEPKILDYLNMTIISILWFNIIFQMPFILLFCLYQDFFDIKFLKKNRKIFLMNFIIISALITPPDVITQLIIALPLTLFFELILFFSYLKQTYKTHRKLLDW